MWCKNCKLVVSCFPRIFLSLTLSKCKTKQAERKLSTLVKLKAGHQFVLPKGAKLTNGAKGRICKHASTSVTCTEKRQGLHEWAVPEGLDTGIKVYNSLTKQKEPLILPNGRLVNWYTCGPTVYDHAHIGHASSYVRADVIRRILLNHFNIDVVYVMGVTDIDDKIINRSKELNIDYKRMVRNYEDSFFRDLQTLQVLEPSIKTRVTDHIPQIINFIQRIMRNGFAYRVPSGSVYFDLDKYSRYGRFVSHSMDMSMTDTVESEKNNPRDFALWKTAKPNEPFWESPFSKGRPGWHIECSVMATGIFGETFDLHSGGEDLKFPHHENEIAQSEACFCSEQWVNYWLHTGHLHVKGEHTKMSKSLKNTIRISELLGKYTPNDFRLFCMLQPYRYMVEFSAENMEKAVTIKRIFNSFINTANAYVSGELPSQPINETYLLYSLNETKKRVDFALGDDFDTPRAINAIEELVRRTNCELHERKSKVAAGPNSPAVILAVTTYVERMLRMFGLHVSKKSASSYQACERLNKVLDGVLQFRSNVRNFAINPPVSEEDASLGLSAKEIKKKNSLHYKALLDSCDNLRDELKVTGVIVKDRSGEKVSWEIQEPTISEVTKSAPVKKKS